MSLQSSNKGVVRGIVAMGFVPALVLAPASAHAGFFEQLFGIQQVPDVQQSVPAQPRYDYLPRRQTYHALHPAQKKVVAVINSGKQTPTDLMSDKTLRPGDAVMMADGIHVYAGTQRPTHQTSEFVSLAKSSLPRDRRVALASVDATHVSVADKNAGSAGTLASGRSAAVSAPIVEGRSIIDPRGKRVRYIGP